jgi:hypothetical protein
VLENPNGIQNVQSAPQNARTTSYSIVHDERGGRGLIFHLFLLISPQENNEKMVSSI